MRWKKQSYLFNQEEKTLLPSLQFEKQLTSLKSHEENICWWTKNTLPTFYTRALKSQVYSNPWK